MAMANLLAFSVVAVAVFAGGTMVCTLPAVEAAVFTVGDRAGWDISSDLPSWVANKSFNVGDVLLFQYSTYHSLCEVDKASFDNCSTSNTLLMSNDGNTSFPLAKSGSYYFICGTLLHCLGGMKLQVNVQDGPSTTVSPAGAPPQLPEVPPSPAGSITRPSSVDDRRTPSYLSSGAASLQVGLIGYNFVEWYFCIKGLTFWLFGLISLLNW